jgi:two-component system, OmpR family, sensor histidine kinase CpxA
MNKYPITLNKKFSLGIGLKLFLVFWLVILTTVLISYLVTKQSKHNPTQEEGLQEHLVLLQQYIKKMEYKKGLDFRKVQAAFNDEHQKHLIIKRMINNKIFAPKKGGWGDIKEYLAKYSLESAVTIDFEYTQITSSRIIIFNGAKYQLFAVNQLLPKKRSVSLVSLVNHLPFSTRLSLSLVISFLCCWLLARSFTSPLIVIQKASRDIGKGKLTTRVTKFNQRSDEFGDLARSFNKMAERLENNITAHQRLLGDVSHELRSPLTRLQLAIALAEKNIDNKLEQQKHLNRCETEADRLDEMIADVLTLSRLEHNQSAFVAEAIELSTLVSHVVNDCQYFATSQKVTITLKDETNFALLADSKLLASAISNIINNAVKYTPNDQVVTVELKEEHGNILLIVSDHGPGVPTEMIDKLFIPFFRVGDGRERSSGGIGLGLAIAQQAITLHQGKIIAENIKPTGLRVTISLPLLTAKK